MVCGKWGNFNAFSKLWLHVPLSRQNESQKSNDKANLSMLNGFSREYDNKTYGTKIMNHYSVLIHTRESVLTVVIKRLSTRVLKCACGLELVQ